MLDIQKLLSPSTVMKNGKADGSGMITPLNIVEDMLDILPDEVWDKNSTFLDPVCKSGNFLAAIYNRLINHPRVIEQLGDDYEYRREWILNNQLYGIAMREFDAMLATRNVYGELRPDSHIVYIPNYIESYIKIEERIPGNRLRTKLKETFGTMKFDHIVGNPPYNNDIYIKFILQLKDSYDKHMLMITPAKWQAKGGELNEQFRKEIVPYMSKIVYYPNAGDVFDIRNLDGISYYLVDNKLHSSKLLKVSDMHEKHKEMCQDWHYSNIKYNLHCEYIVNIINKVVNDKKLLNRNHKGKNYVNVSLMLSSGGGKTSFSNYTSDGKLLVLNPMSIDSYIGEGNYKNLFSSDSIDECKSYISYTNTKLIRFILYVSCCGNSVTAKETWRFVPDPGAFDHIFTDAELYQKYNLTEEEINIIESVIKERK